MSTYDLAPTRPVEELNPGDHVMLPHGLSVEVQRVDEYPEKQAGAADGPWYIVRWRSGGRYGRGHRLEGEPVELGSLGPKPAGEPVKVPAE